MKYMRIASCISRSLFASSHLLKATVKLFTLRDRLCKLRLRGSGQRRVFISVCLAYLLYGWSEMMQAISP